MASEVFNLAILLTLKDAASGGLDRIEAKMRSAGKEGKKLADEYNSLRESLNRDLAIGGIGVAGLGAIYKGIQAAGDFQAKMTDLQATLATSKGGSVDLNALGADMQKAEVIAVKLGNALPGTTADFVEMMQVLKQNGLETTTIMDGAAESVAHLAVANNAIPKEIAADFAQYGNLFKLKPEEFQPAADVFSRIFTSTGQTSAELVEAAKYFEGRAGASLGISGLKDAQQITQLFGLMGKSGIRGSIAGTSLTDFFSEYSKHADKVEELKAATGIKLDFFDAKGNFAGMDTVFEQMKQFDKLTNKEKIDWNEWIFGLRGMSAANLFIDEGTEGWKKFNAEQNKTISLQDKVAAKSATFNNQMEALSGTLENLGITVFEPMLPGLTSAIGKTNEFVGSIQEFAKAHPDLMKWSVELAAYGSSAMVVYSGFKTLTTGVKMFQIASELRNGNGLLSYLSDTAKGADTATKRVAGFTGSLGAAETKSAGLTKKVGAFQKIASSPITIVLGIAAAEAAITTLLQHFDEIDERQKKVVEYATTISQNYDNLSGRGLLYNTPGNFKDSKGNDRTSDFDSWAKQFIDAIKEGKTLETNLHPEKASWWEHYKNLSELPYGSYDKTGGQFNPSVAANRWSNAGLTKGLQDPNQLSRVLVQLRQSDGGFNLDDIKLIEAALQKNVGGDKFKIASEIAKLSNGGNQQTTPQKPLGFLNTQPLFPKIQPSPLPNMFQPPQPKPLFGTPPMIKGFDEATLTGKIVPTITNMFSSLTPEFKAAATQTFSGMQQAGGDWQASLLRISQDTGTTSQDLLNFGKSVIDTQPPLSGLVSSANSAKAGLDSLGIKFANYQIPVPNIQTITIPTQQGANGQPIGKVGSYAVGGAVKSDGFAYIHAGEEIRPADVAKGYRTPNETVNERFPDIDAIIRKSRSSSQNTTINAPLTLTINGNVTKEDKQEFARKLDEHARRIADIVGRNMRNSHERE